MADTSTPTVINAFRAKVNKPKEVVSPSKKVPFKMTLTDENMPLKPSLRESVVGMSKDTITPTRDSTKRSDETRRRAARQQGLSEDTFSDTPPDPDAGYFGEPIRPPEVPFASSTGELFSEEEVKTLPASRFKSSLEDDQKLEQAKFERALYEKQLQLRRDSPDYGGRAPGDLGAIETFFLGDDERSTLERAEAKAKGITGAALSGGAQGATLIPLAIDHTHQLGSWFIENLANKASGAPYMPYNKNYMRNNVMSELTKNMMVLSQDIEKDFGVDNNSVFQKIVERSAEFVVPINTLTKPYEVGKALVMLSKTAGQGKTMAKRVQTAWKDSLNSALRTRPKIAVDLENAVAANEARQAQKAVITAKTKLKELKSTKPTLKEIDNSPHLNTARKNVAKAELEAEEAIAKANLFEDVVKAYKPVIKGSVDIKKTGKNLFDFQIIAKSNEGISGTIFVKNAKTGIMEAKQITRAPTAADVAKNRARNRFINNQAAMGGGITAGFIESNFQGTPYENWKYIGPIFGGVLLQPSNVLKLANRISEGIQRQVQKTYIPLGSQGTGVVSKTYDAVVGTPAKAIYGEQGATLGVGNIFILAAILAHNVEKYGISQLYKTRLRTEGQIENPKGYNKLINPPTVVNPNKVLFDSPYERRLLAAMGGVPLTKAFTVDATKPLMKTEIGSDGVVRETKDKLFKTPKDPSDPTYRNDLSPTADENFIYPTALDIHVEANRFNVQRLQNVAEDIMNNLSREQISGIIKVHEDSAELHAKLLRMGKEDNFEDFQLTFQMTNQAFMAQQEVGAFSKLMTDAKYQTNYLPMFGRLQEVFGVTATKAATPEGRVMLDLLEASLKDVDINIGLISKRLKRISEDPALAKEFSSYTAAIKTMTEQMKNNQTTLRNEILKRSTDATPDASKIINEEAMFAKAVYASREDGGLGLNQKFDLNYKDRSTHEAATADHATAMNNNIEGVMLTLNEKVKELFRFKDVDDPLNQVLKETLVDGSPIFKAMDKLKNTEIDEKVINLREAFGSDWVEFGQTQSKSLIDDLKAYSAYISLRGKSTKELEEILQSIDNVNAPVQLRNTSYNQQGQKTDIQADKKGEAGLIDVSEIRSKLDTYALYHGDTVELGKRQYLLHLLANMEQRTGRNVEFEGSSTYLNDRIGNEFKITDILGLTERIGTYGFKNRLSESGAASFNVTEATTSILDSVKVLDMSQEAKELWARTKRLKEVMLKDLPNQRNLQGKTNQKEEYEYLDFFFTKSPTYVETFYKNLYDPIKKDGANDVVFEKAKKEMNSLLSDHLGLRMVTNPDFRKAVFSTNGERNIKNLHSKGIIDDETFTFYTNYKKIEKSIPSLIKDYKQEYNSLERLIKGATDKAKETLKESSLFKELTDIKDADGLYDFFSGSNINSLFSPKIISGASVNPEILSQIKTSFKNLDMKATDDIITILDKNPNITPVQLQDLVESFMPVSIKEAQTTRVDGFFEYVLGIKPGQDLTKANIASLNSLEKVLNASLASRALKITDTRKSALSEGDSTLVNNPSFGLAETIDVKEFANHLINLDSLYKRMDSLTGNTTRQNNIAELFKISVATQAKSTPAYKTLADMIGNPAGQLTLPGALGRSFSGIRGVVSWKYLAAEQVARQTNLGKQRMLMEMLSDPSLITTLIKVGVLKRKTTAEELKTFLDKKIAKISGARLIAFNEMKEEILNPTPEQILKSFQDNFNLFEFSKLISTAPIEQFTNRPEPTRPIQPMDVEFSDGFKGSTVLEGPLQQENKTLDIMREIRDSPQ